MRQAIHQSVPPAQAPTSPPPVRSTKPTAKLWGMEDLRNLKGMAVEEPKEMMRELDRRGMSPVTFAAIMAAIQTESLLPLLSLLEPGEAEASKLDVLLEAVEKVIDSQARLEARQAAIESGQVGIASRLAAIESRLAVLR